jgi:hypothetical protein
MAKKVKRVSIGTDNARSVKVRLELKKLGDAWQERTELLKTINEATGQQLNNLEEITAYLKKRVGFPNLDLCAEAFNVQSEYVRLKAVDSTPDVTDKLATDEKGDLIQLPNGSYQMTEDYEKVFKEQTTKYIEGENLEIYQKMLEFKEFYDGLENKFKNGGAIQFNGIAPMSIRQDRFI